MDTALQRLYFDQKLYSSKDMFSPPAERLSHVIRFELTQGCEWRKCTYCCGYDKVKNLERTIEGYANHVENVFDWLQVQNYRDLTRVFVGGGNALAVNTNKLLMAIGYTGIKFKQHTGKFPKRTSVYGRTASINEKGREQLQFLREGLYEKGKINVGLDLIYWGVETGSNAVMEYVRKGSTQDDVLKAAEVLKDTGIKTSVMIMPGLGGARFYNEHVQQTALVLDAIKPAYVTFMGVNPSSDSRYSKTMQQELLDGLNRPLSDSELATQMADIVEGMFGWDRWDVKLGCYSPTIDAVGHNPITFDSVDIRRYMKPTRTPEDNPVNILVRDLRRQAGRLQEIEKLRNASLNPVIKLNPEFNKLGNLERIIFNKLDLHKGIFFSNRSIQEFAA